MPISTVVQQANCSTPEPHSDCLPATAARHRKQLQRLEHQYEHARRQRDAAYARMVALVAEAGRLGAEQRERRQRARDGGCSCATCTGEPPCAVCGNAPAVVPLHLPLPPDACRRCGVGVAS